MPTTRSEMVLSKDNNTTTPPEATLSVATPSLDEASKGSVSAQDAGEKDGSEKDQVVHRDVVDVGEKGA